MYAICIILNAAVLKNNSTLYDIIRMDSDMYVCK